MNNNETTSNDNGETLSAEEVMARINDAEVQGEQSAKELLVLLAFVEQGTADQKGV